MASLRLIEITTDLVIDYLKANMPAALADVRTDRADAAVTTEPPKFYARYVPTKAYQVPAIWVTSEEQPVMIDAGPNYVKMKLTMQVTCEVEDRTAEMLFTRGCRYQAAIAKLLNLTQLTTPDQSVKIVTKLKSTRFSSVYVLTGVSLEDGPFRREVMVELEVEHWENL